MKLSSVVLSLIPSVLGEVIGPAEPASDCHADNCYLDVAGNDVRFDWKSRREDCSKFMATATPASTAPAVKPTKPTAVRAIHVHAVAPRAESEPVAATTGLPVYASLCDSVAAYSSACSCWGVTTAGKVNADAVPTAVATTPIGISSLSSVLSSSRPTTNSSTAVSSTLTTSSSSATSPTTRSSVSPSSSISTIKSSTSSSTSKSSTSTAPTTKSSSTTTHTTSFSSTTFSSTSTLPTSTTTTNGTTTGCAGGQCGTYRSWSCNGPLGDCLCGFDADGKTFCFEDNVCSLETNCVVNKDCPSTQRCVVGSCCEVGKCVIERKDGVCGNQNSARAIFRVRGEGMGKKRCEDGRNSGSC